MKSNNGLFNKVIIISLMTVLCFLAFSPATGSTQEMGAEFAKEVKPPASISYQTYTDLSELITVLCDEANLKFKNFYGPGLVKVEPFITIGEFQKNKISELGVTLADQMISVINNDTLKQSKNSSKGGNIPQHLSGVLQEVDGYLRVHISGVNSCGQRVSYVTNVEMSDPIYRALHTFL